MKITDLLEETTIALSMNKVRSGLTMLGIVIGVGSVVAMISIGQGAQASVEERIQSVGSNLLSVTPGVQREPGARVSAGRGSAQTLNREDAEAIREQVSYIEAVAPETSNRYQIITKGANTNTTVNGTVACFTQVKNYEIAQGSFISDQDVRTSAKVAVLGPTTRDDLFGEDTNAVGQRMRINGIIFTVVGVTNEKGGSGFSSPDDVVFVPLTTAQRFLSGNDYVGTINVQVEDEKFMSSAKEEITALLLARHNISNAENADFSVVSQAELLETMTEVTNTFTIFLGAIAGISLVVGGIGIMNMMLTTVTERTQEIGLRKSIGADRKDISRQFLAESVMLTFIGGTTGIIIGWLVSIGMARIADMDTKVSLFSVILAFCVSAFIGIAFGYFPAKRAASLNPIEALRYE